MSPNYAYAAVMFLAGIGIPMLAALNASLGARIGSPAVAALCLFGVAVLVAALAVAVTGTGVSPNIDDTLRLLGKERTLTRLKKASEFIEARAKQ